MTIDHLGHMSRQENNQPLARIRRDQSRHRSSLLRRPYAPQTWQQEEETSNK